MTTAPQAGIATAALHAAQVARERAGVIPPQRKSEFSPRRRAAVRLSELKRVTLWCVGQGAPLNPHAVTEVAADALTLQREPPDVPKVVQFLQRAGIEIANEDRALAAIERALARAEAKLARDRRYQGMHPQAAGKRLGLTVEARTACRIRTMEAGNETADERRARKAAEKRCRDRERARAKRAAAGSVSRIQYLAQSLSRSRPWEAEGISRRTWERRRKAAPTRDASPSRTYVSANVGRRTCGTDGGQAAARTSR